MPVPLLRVPNQQVDPLSIFGRSNVLQWLRADTNVTVDGTTRVTQISDLSGNAKHGTATGTARPDFLATSGPGGRACISSGTYGTASLDMGTTGVDMSGKDWAQAGVVLSETNPGTAATFWTSRNIPAGGSVARPRRDSGTRISYLIDSASGGGTTFLSVAQPDGAPPPIWLAWLHTGTAAGVRNLYVYGDITVNPTQPGTNTTTNGANFAPSIAEGWIFREVAATFWQRLSFYEKFDLAMIPSATQRNQLRAYWRGIGVAT